MCHTTLMPMQGAFVFAVFLIQTAVGVTPTLTFTLTETESLTQERKQVVSPTETIGYQTDSSCSQQELGLETDKLLLEVGEGGTVRTCLEITVADGDNGFRLLQFATANDVVGLQLAFNSGMWAIQRNVTHSSFVQLQASPPSSFCAFTSAIPLDVLLPVTYTVEADAPPVTTTNYTISCTASSSSDGLDTVLLVVGICCLVLLLVLCIVGGFCYISKKDKERFEHVAFTDAVNLLDAKEQMESGV
eukprot:TRINITY_DN9702_c0_g6_i1.p1 TRINITY_DN9702_c0_g6~~TRINITY_DN9702_c0_g6_i1.p1  ORF type:complete len:246 (+),score=35.05 TRINITY_DN9702_c0_g6_i1:67-804(+)